MHILCKACLMPTLLAGLAVMAHPVHAQNLVQDGSFEAADLGAADGSEDTFDSTGSFDTSWTITQGTAAIDTTNQYVFDGSKSLYLDQDTTTTTIVTQSLATTPGGSYVLSFYADDEGGNPLTVSFGGTTLGPINIPLNGYPNTDPGSNAGAFTFYTFDVPAQGSATPLTFSADNNGNGQAIELDDISVTPAAVPEASTLVSMGLLLGLGGAACAARRKRAAA